ncbi:copper transporter [Actinomadura parmotrematis]|uniref:Copper transporter n=1 Tax=Actinomadura parmotrematis TaxID=2864039 RepID=A0ABS7FS44_9ACTN|nr:copper transporter [Actinomadura parmotrematis]MBW8483181.1 copper transporter [Actinomadura parmotrematis]
MIDFRYHLVSIVAIFLALALGIILGSTTLSDSVTSGLKREATAAAKRNETLRQEQAQLTRQTKGEEQFAQILGPQIVTGRLAGQSVVLVETPGAGNDGIERLGELAQQAGATVTGRVTLQKKFLDDDQAATVDELAAQLKPAGVQFAADATPYGKAGQVLASALVAKAPADTGREDAVGGSILNGFRQAGYVTTSGKPGQHATLAIMVAPSTPYTAEGGDADNKALLAVASALDAGARGSVLGGPQTAAAKGGLVAALRDGDEARSISSVDTVDTASGQVVTVLALQNEMAGKAGQYGIGDGVSGYLPSPAPAAGKNG